ncbi:MAG: HAD-IIA family hydrolase [Pirellulales bacterium]
MKKTLTEWLREVQHVVLDMDGTIYLDGVLFNSTKPFLKTLTELSIGHTFLTNNNSRSRADYTRHLESLGLEVKPTSIFTSAHGTLEYMATYFPEIQRVSVLGMSGLVEDFELGGLIVTKEQPEAVIVGFDRHLTYDSLSRTAYWIEQGLPYLATHPDAVCPTRQPTVLPDCGAICALLEVATGRRPDAVPGKPSREMLAGVMQQHQLKAEQLAMVGDRIYTDIKMALMAGSLSVLTLTGEATADDAAQSMIHPDLVVEDLEELAHLLVTAKAL